MKIRFILAGILCVATVSARADGLDDALISVIENCSGIAAEFNDMKKMAGINTAVTGVGTAVGAGAIATGFIKADKDAAAAQIEIRLEELRQIESSRGDAPAITAAQILQFETDFDNYADTARAEAERMQAELDKLTKQSKSLGNWRTGLMAGNTATNIAGAIIAANNRAKSDLRGAIDACKSAVAELQPAYMQARLDGMADAEKISAAQTIVSECGKWDMVNMSQIDNRARNAMISSIAGAATGTAGTITSAVANTDATRSGDNAREKNLNTASNVLAIGATAASGAATIFNATQISAIKRASEIADSCERALQ
ncbi:MAG: hypothetical protein LBR41_03180 [Rickettsiales bacterium]|jgi:hypothetical protein|nr:hypothetical protein [Rickettsiales bacterium]